MRLDVSGVEEARAGGLVVALCVDAEAQDTTLMIVRVVLAPSSVTTLSKVGFRGKHKHSCSRQAERVRNL